MGVSHPNKGQAWGGGAKVECPHCKTWKGRAHIRFCPKNPDRDEAALQQRSQRMRELRAQQTAAGRTPPATQPTAPPPAPMSDPTPPPAAGGPLDDVAQPPSAPQAGDGQGPRRVGPDFMQKRIAELRKTPQDASAAPAAQPVVPSGVSVREKQGIGGKAIAKVATLVGALALAFIGWRVWRNHRRPGTGQSTAPVNVEPERRAWEGPRAWTPEPRKVSPDDYIPSEHGGGFVPSPQTSWAEAQAAHLNKRQGGN